MGGILNSLLGAVDLETGTVREPVTIEVPLS
jgi:hypothetical protein